MLLWTLLAFFGGAECANILGVTVLNSHSHHIWNEVLAVALAERGHNVTLISHDHKKVQHDNYHLLYIEGGYDVWDSLDFEKTVDEDSFMDSESFWDYMNILCNKAIESSAFKALNNYPPDYKFDLIIWDITAGECMYPLIKRFGKPPVVGISAFGIQPHISWYMGAHLYSYTPFFCAHHKTEMTFMEKIKNVYHMANWIYIRQMKFMPKAIETAKRVFGNDIDDLHEVERNISMALLNNDPNLDFPLALPPNIVFVGGLQVARTKPLNKEFQKIFDDAKDHIIYFSLGSNLKSEKLDGGILDAFIDCFETLPQTILWKIDNKDLKLPKNVIAKKWMPQSDILANSKTRAFISHGGMLGVQEAMYHGVPIVGVPFFLDQINNIKKLASRDLGVQIKLKSATKDYVCNAIKTVLQPKYYDNMQLVSKRTKDQMNTPLEKAVFSVEYVLRHGGAEHLSVAVRDMNVFQSQNLDILAVIVAAVLGPIILVYFTCILCCSNKNTSKKVKRN